MEEKVICNKEDLTAIANAVRTSTGNTQTYNVPELSIATVTALENSTGTISGNAVLYTEQELSEEQKAQARENIDAVSVNGWGANKGLGTDENGNIIETDASSAFYADIVQIDETTATYSGCTLADIHNAYQAGKACFMRMDDQILPMNRISENETMVAYSVPGFGVMFFYFYDDYIEIQTIMETSIMTVFVTSAGGGEYTADKTNAEIYEAFASGKVVVCNSEIGVLYMNNISDTNVVFRGVEVDDGVIKQYVVQIRNDNTTVNNSSTTIPTKLPNPNSLIINGVEYDGSEAVEIINSVSYKAFGASLDGVTDDTEAAIACHNYANQHGCKVEQHEGILFLETATEDNCPIIKTSCDWTGMKIRVSESMGRNIIMRVEPDAGIQSVNLTQDEISQLSKDTINIPFLTGYPNSICHFTTDISIGNRLNKTETYVYHETVTTDRYGNLIDGALFREMTDATTISMEHQSIFETPIEIKGAKIILDTLDQPDPAFDYSYIPCIEVRRSNTTISDMSLTIVSSNSSNSTVYRGELIKIANCYNITVEKISGENFGTFFTEEAQSATCYLLYCTGLSRFTLKDCVMLRSWGPIQTQYCKDVVVRDSTLGRMDNHYHCRNYTIENCTFTTSQSCINIGYGDGQVIINNVRFVKFIDADTPFTSYCIHLRGEFCALYTGKLIINNVYIDNQSGRYVTLLTGGYKDYYDFGNSNLILPLGFPETIIENITYTSDNVEIVNYQVLEESYPIVNNLQITAREINMCNIRRVDISTNDDIRLRAVVQYNSLSNVILEGKYGIVLSTPYKVSLRISSTEDILIQDSWINGTQGSLGGIVLRLNNCHVYGYADWQYVGKLILHNCNIYVSSSGILRFNTQHQVIITECIIEERNNTGIITTLELPSRYYLRGNYCITSELPEELAHQLMGSNTINQVGALADKSKVITNDHLGDRIVSNAKIAFGAVSNACLASKTIEYEKLSDTCVESIAQYVLTALPTWEGGSY